MKVVGGELKWTLLDIMQVPSRGLQSQADIMPELRHQRRVTAAITKS